MDQECFKIRGLIRKMETHELLLDWIFTSCRASLSSSVEIDRFTESTSIKPPEMVLCF